MKSWPALDFIGHVPAEQLAVMKAKMKMTAFSQ
jgi:hypothetical protein